jgi:hypothetical protein
VTFNLHHISHLSGFLFNKYLNKFFYISSDIKVYSHPVQKSKFQSTYSTKEMSNCCLPLSMRNPSKFYERSVALFITGKLCSCLNSSNHSNLKRFLPSADWLKAFLFWKWNNRDLSGSRIEEMNFKQQQGSLKFQELETLWVQHSILRPVCNKIFVFSMVVCINVLPSVTSWCGKSFELASKLLQPEIAWVLHYLVNILVVPKNKSYHARSEGNH